MDKKAKKRIEVLKEKQQRLRLQIAGAKQQLDDPEELKKLEKESAAITAELEQLRNS
jgi:hypothetical protein